MEFSAFHLYFFFDEMTIIIIHSECDEESNVAIIIKWSSDDHSMFDGRGKGRRMFSSLSLSSASISIGKYPA